jgi:hypothetical protein
MYGLPDSFHIDRIAGEKDRSKVKVAILVVREAKLHLVGLSAFNHLWSTQDPTWN